MSSETPEQGDGEKGGSPCGASSSSAVEAGKQKEMVRVSWTSLILWHAHENDAATVRKLLEEDRSLINARLRPLHVALLHGWADVAKCLHEFGTDVNPPPRRRCHNPGHIGLLVLVDQNLIILSSIW